MSEYHVGMPRHIGEILDQTAYLRFAAKPEGAPNSER